MFLLKVVEDGYEFFANRQLVTIFSAPNYCGEFDNSGAMMSVDDSLMCSFQILKPAEKKSKYAYISVNSSKPATPPRGAKVIFPEEHSYPSHEEWKHTIHVFFIREPCRLPVSSIQLVLHVLMASF